MEAVDLASELEEACRNGGADVPGAQTSPGYEETDFFVDIGGERFLVAVMKVSE